MRRNPVASLHYYLSRQLVKEQSEQFSVDRVSRHSVAV